VTDHRDPVEAWLSADVQVLSPPPGTFERVRRRARRRKAVRAMSAAGGAAVVVAAAATLPQVAKGLSPSPPGAPGKVVTGTASPSKEPSKQKPGGTKSPALQASASALPGHGPALSGAGSGRPPASGFRPISVTFVGLSGAVLGQAGSCGTRPCTVMAGTPNYGNSWSKIGAPPAGPPNGSSGVSQVRFLGTSDGWAYGPELYATHSGGRTWHHFSTRGRVIDVSTIGTRVFAVIGTGCAGIGSDFAAGCTGFALYSANASSDRWQAVQGAAAAVEPVPGGLQLARHSGFLIASGGLYAGPVTGGAWHVVTPVASAAPRCLTRAAGRGPWLLAAAERALYLVCSSSPPTAKQRLALYISRDGGRTWQVSGAAPAAATSLAVSPGGTLVLATGAGIYLSRDSHTWQVATLTGQAPKGGFGFVGMTTTANGVAVPASTAQQTIFITSDGGRTWRPSVIR
jgi:hypothetical protein